MRTSEWVSLGHPDKTADAISEYILDRYLEKDPNVRYALECQIKDSYVTLSGEITSIALFDEKQYYKWVKEALNKIGYTKEYQNKWGEENTICSDDIQVVTHISGQSLEIDQGVSNKGWGDQGIFFGYAENNETTNYMPLDYYLAKSLGQKLYTMALKLGSIIGLDIKTQVTLDNNDKVEEVIVAVPMLQDCIKDIKDVVIEHMKKYNQELKYDMIIVNGTGIYKKHGPIADCGTTGRKLAVDLYGGNSFIGGGALVTKDGTKADLSLNLYARDLAFESLKSEKRNDVKYIRTALSCCIGKNDVRVSIKGYGNNNDVIFESSDNIFKITPKDLIEKYKLNEPRFFDMNKEGFFKDIV